MTELARFSQVVETLNRPGNPDEAKSLKAWKSRSMITRAALLELRAEYDKKISEAAERYSPTVAAEKIEELRAEYNSFKQIAVARVQDGLSSTLELKRQTYKKNSGAPTEEALRLLQALQMRKSLSPADIANAAQHLHGNVQALEILRERVRDAGYTFPSILSVEEFERAMEEAEAFARDKLDSIDQEPDAMSYKHRMFWMYDGTGEAEYFFNPLDSNELSAAQITPSGKAAEQEAEEDETDKRSVFDGGAWSKVKLHGGETLAGLSYQFHVSSEEIRKANPGEIHITPGAEILIPSTRMRVINDETGHHTDHKDVQLVAIPDFAKIGGGEV